MSVSHTTRPQRSGEIEGKDYYFISEAEFQQQRQTNEFLEWAEVFGYHYGTSKTAVQHQLDQGKTVVLEIDCQGAEQVRQKLANTSIMIVPPSISVLRERLEQRGQDHQVTIERRLSEAQEELAQQAKFDFVVVNQMFDQAGSELKRIFLSCLQPK